MLKKTLQYSFFLEKYVSTGLFQSHWFKKNIMYYNFVISYLKIEAFKRIYLYEAAFLCLCDLPSNKLHRHPLKKMISILI